MVSNEYTKSNLSTLKLQDPSSLFIPGVLPDARILSSILAPSNYVWGNGFPNETASIKKRIESTPSNGLVDWYFNYFDYILCFNSFGVMVVNKLLEAYNADRKIKGNSPARVLSSQIRLLNGCDFQNWQIKDLTKLSQMAGAVKTAIKQFLTSEFGWDQDVCAQWPKSLRTLQIPMKTSDMKHVMKDKDGIHWEDTAKIRRWKEITGCYFWIAFEKWGEKGDKVWLVSIIGEEGRLLEAEALVRNTNI